MALVVSVVPDVADFVRVKMLLVMALVPVFFFYTRYGYGQEFDHEGYGARVGVIFRFGTVINRLGLTAGGFVTGDGAQLNAHTGWYYNISSIGPPLSGAELVISIGGVVAWGDEQDWNNKFINPVSNQTGRKYSLAYAYNYYIDQIGTSQPTGTLALQIDKFYCITENDAFGFQGGDKYRTGALRLALQHEDEQFAVNTILWTGNASKDIQRIRDSSYPGRYGYKDLSESHYGKLSNGLFRLQYGKVIGGYQKVQVGLGVDAEQVRHLLQNKVMHDMYFVSEKLMATRNLHVPMLTDQGEPYLFQENQVVRPPKFFFSMALNPNLFY